MQVPHCQPGEWPKDIPSSRLAAHVQLAFPTGCRVALLGLPDDLGVRLNNGRAGAKEGPTAFRHALAKYGVAHPSPTHYPRVFDAGDVVPATGNTESSLHETHRRVSEASAALVHAGLFPIAIGGGHDLTYAFVRGVWQAWHDQVNTTPQPWAGVYLDAHLDVRDTPGSGMPFRKLIDDGISDRLLIAGFDPFANAQEHVAWFESHAGTIIPDVARYGLPQQSIKTLTSTHGTFCSFDMDVLDQSIAPGVSAMNPCGLSVEKAATALALISRIPSLRCLDFMELSPPHDDQGRTARVAAHLFLTVLMVLSQGLFQEHDATRGAS